MTGLVWFGIKGGGADGRTEDGRTYRITSERAGTDRLYTAFSVDADNRMTKLPVLTSIQMNVVKVRVWEYLNPPPEPRKAAPVIEVKAPPMTTEEIALYRDVLHWCKANNVLFQQHNGRWMEPTSYETMRGPIVGRSVEIWNNHGAWELGIDAHGGSRTPDVTWHKVTSVAQAVDLLVFLGMLPQRFSSAYRAGWHACKIWYSPEGYVDQSDAAEFSRLFHDPHNISFPAGVDA